MEKIKIEEGFFKTGKGLFCETGDFYLDPVKPVKHAVISHAHADHATNGHEHMYCTLATADFMRARYGSTLTGTFHLYDYHQTFTINNIRICFYSAGHMLGSAQILLQTGGRKILFTGDIKLQADKTCTPYEVVPCDTIVTESTFASPGVIHPDASNEIKRINQYPGINIILGSYVLGKAQRLLSLIDEHVTNKVVVCHADVVKFNKVYEAHNIRFANWLPYSRRYFKQNQHCIYIVPPQTYRYYYNKVKTVKAFATGWEKLQVGADFKIYISDHVDWNDLLYVIEQSQAEKIVTLHGDGTALQKHFVNTAKEFLVL